MVPQPKYHASMAVNGSWSSMTDSCLGIIHVYHNKSVANSRSKPMVTCANTRRQYTNLTRGLHSCGLIRFAAEMMANICATVTVSCSYILHDAIVRNVWLVCVHCPLTRRFVIVCIFEVAPHRYVTTMFSIKIDHSDDLEEKNTGKYIIVNMTL